MFRNLLSLCVVVSLSTSAYAGVMSADHAKFGVGSLTRDTAQGLDFLDVTRSLGLAIGYVSSQFGLDGEFEGFRYATEVEVITLINNYGFTPGAAAGALVNGVGPGGELSGLVALLGDTLNGGVNFTLTYGLTGDLSLNGVREVVIVNRISSTPDYVDALRFSSPNTASSNIGSYLVASSPVTTTPAVPEPASITAFAGLLGIGLIVRRRQQNLSDR